VIGIGYWEQKKRTEFKELVKSKDLSILLSSAGYKVLLVGEFRTSCQCSYCQTETVKCEKFVVRLDPKTQKSTEGVYPRLLHIHIHNHQKASFKKEACKRFAVKIFQFNKQG